MKALLFGLTLLGSTAAAPPAPVRVTFSPLTKAAYLQALKGKIVTKPRTTFPLKKKQGRLVIPTAKGQRVFRDATVVEDNPEWEKFDYEGYLPRPGCHLVFHRHYEWAEEVLVTASGQQLNLPEAPVFAPDTSAFVVVSASLDNEMMPNILQVFRLKHGAWHQIWKLEPKTWEPEQADWLSPTTLLLEQKHWNKDFSRAYYTYARLTIQ